MSEESEKFMENLRAGASGRRGNIRAPRQLNRHFLVRLVQSVSRAFDPVSFELSIDFHGEFPVRRAEDGARCAVVLHGKRDSDFTIRGFVRADGEMMITTIDSPPPFNYHDAHRLPSENTHDLRSPNTLW